VTDALTVAVYEGKGVVAGVLVTQAVPVPLFDAALDADTLDARDALPETAVVADGKPDAVVVEVASELLDADAQLLRVGKTLADADGVGMTMLMGFRHALAGGMIVL
jgi:hypothetical protein